MRELAEGGPADPCAKLTLVDGGKLLRHQLISFLIRAVLSFMKQMNARKRGARELESRSLKQKADSAGGLCVLPSVTEEIFVVAAEHFPEPLSMKKNESAIPKLGPASVSSEWDISNTSG